MPRSKAPAPETPADPLADLRQDDGPQAAPAPPLQVIPPDDLAGSTREALELADGDLKQGRLVVSEAVQDDMVNVAVAALHADLTCQGFLHGGGACGCRYIARTVLQAAVPVALEQDQEDTQTEGPDA